MKISSLGGDDARFDMTPMMDIVFQLIAFFMIVATYVTREKVELDLPLAVNAAIAENQQDRVLISISVDGQVWAGSRPVSLDELSDEVIKYVRRRARVLNESGGAELPTLNVAGYSPNARGSAVIEELAKTFPDGTHREISTFDA